jgi:hypothetical protein
MGTIRKKMINPNVQHLSAAQLLALLQQPTEHSNQEITRQFENVHRLIESLPLTSAEYGFAHNWLTSARELWEAGDLATAHYQVTAVARKLHL